MRTLQPSRGEVLGGAWEVVSAGVEPWGWGSEHSQAFAIMEVTVKSQHLRGHGICWCLGLGLSGLPNYGKGFCYSYGTGLWYFVMAASIADQGTGSSQAIARSHRGPPSTHESWGMSVG